MIKFGTNSGPLLNVSQCSSDSPNDNDIPSSPEVHRIYKLSFAFTELATSPVKTNLSITQTRATNQRNPRSLFSSYIPNETFPILPRRRNTDPLLGKPRTMGSYSLRRERQVFPSQCNLTIRETGKYEIASPTKRYIYAGWLSGMGIVFAYAFLFVPSRHPPSRIIN